MRRLLRTRSHKRMRLPDYQGLRDSLESLANVQEAEEVAAVNEV